MPESFVSVRHVGFSYPEPTGFFKRSASPNEPVLNDVSFELPIASTTVMFGLPGTGKSTLMHLLAGTMNPSTGTIDINGDIPANVKQIAAGFVSPEEHEDSPDSVLETLKAFASTHDILGAAQKITELSHHGGLDHVMHRPVRSLSLSERLRVNIARAFLSDSPLILLDDVADNLGVQETKQLLNEFLHNQTVIATTRHADTAQELDFPLLILHRNKLAHQGPAHDIANEVTAPRVIDAWIEGLQYNILRKLRAHEGVKDVRLLPSDSLKGQRLRITLHSGRFLPSFYDLLSTAPLVKVEEHPVSLDDIVDRLP